MMALLTAEFENRAAQSAADNFPDLDPIFVEPVAETKARAVVDQTFRTVGPSPMTRLKIAGSTSFAAADRSAILIVAIAHSGV